MSWRQISIKLKAFDIESKLAKPKGINVQNGKANEQRYREPLSTTPSSWLKTFLSENNRNVRAVASPDTIVKKVESTVSFCFSCKRKQSKKRKQREIEIERRERDTHLQPIAESPL